MKEEQYEKDVVQYTLQSFVGPHITETRITERQKDAIQRLICLSNEKFDGLCEDIVNEIHNRSGMHHSKSGPMYEKLARLNDEKFRNLVLDTLLVYNYKNPGTEVVKIDDFLNNLESLIKDLKGKSESEKFIEKIKGMELLNVLLQYNEYIKRIQVVDVEITDEIENLINSEIEANSTRFIECLSHPKTFLSRMDEGPLKDSTEYRYHRDNITAMLNNPEKTHLHGSAVAKIMKGELQQIVMLMLERSIIPTERVEMKYPELLVVVSTLERIADDLSGRICVNLESMSDDLISILDKLVSEMEKDPNIDVDLLNKLKMHRVPIEGMANSVTKLDAFKLVVLLAQDLRAIVEIKAKRDR